MNRFLIKKQIVLVLILVLIISLTTACQSESTETIEQIRERAPDNYYMQDRIISGEDYNIAPLRQGNIVLKSKALNRTYSGNSAFIDINDPTGNYQNVNMFGDDGILYQHISTKLAKNFLFLVLDKSNDIYFS